MEVHHHKLKPIKNWREFVKEYGIIVLGVLTALGAEQAAEAIHHRNEVREARQALNGEMAWNLASEQQVRGQAPCNMARLNEVERWATSWKNGQPQKLLRPIAIPGTFGFRTSIWHISSGDAVSRMPLEERSDYAQLYDLIDILQTQRTTAVNAWVDLALYQRARRITDDQLLKIWQDVGAIRGMNTSMAANFSQLNGIARKPHITPGRLPDLEITRTIHAAECKQLLAS